MNIIVFGAGAIGSLYAAKLSARHDVTVVARPAHVQAINESGLRLTGLERATRRVVAVTAIDSIPRDTLVLLTTKVNDNGAAARAMASLVLPAGLSSSGLPIGMEFAGLAGTDRDILALGLSVERVLGPSPAPKI